MAIVKKKIWPEYFEEVASGKKNFEVRLNDFDISEGDTFGLEEWNPNTKSYTGRSIEKKVTYVKKLTIDSFGQGKEIIEKGFQIISIE